MYKVQPQESHWYLDLLGTDPAHQGRGRGSAMFQPALDRCDDEDLPTYLESSKKANISFYRSHGVEVRSEFRPVDGCPPIWPMWSGAR